MNYVKSGIFSNQAEIDSRNLVLYMNFRNEKLPQMAELVKLVEEFFIDKFYEDFVLDIYVNGEDTLAKPLKKKLNQPEVLIGRHLDISYDGILKSEEVSTRGDYRRLIDEAPIVDDEVAVDFKDIEELKKYIIDNINKKEINYNMPPAPQDIGLTLSLDYVSREDDENNFGYFGYISFNISGHILGHDYREFIEHLKNFIRRSSEHLKSQCANIFISDRKFMPDYAFAFTTMNREDGENCPLEGIEGINFLNKENFASLDKSLIEKYGLKVEECENGFFVNVDKDLEAIDIEDKYKLRELLDGVLSKGCSHLDLLQFADLLGRVPIYPNEIIVAENTSAEEMIPDLFKLDESELVTGEALAQQDTSRSFLSRAFVIASNGQAEICDIDSDVRLYRFQEQ